MKFDDEGVFNICQDISLHFGADPISNFQSGFSQDLHRVQRPGILSGEIENLRNVCCLTYLNQN